MKLPAPAARILEALAVAFAVKVLDIIVRKVEERVARDQEELKQQLLIMLRVEIETMLAESIERHNKSKHARVKPKAEDK